MISLQVDAEHWQDARARAGRSLYQDEWPNESDASGCVSGQPRHRRVWSRLPCPGCTRPGRIHTARPESAAGWTFSITPYAWLPTVSTTYSYTGPRGARVTNTISAGIGDYISELNFELMLGGEARYDRFTIMTDLVYANASITTKNSHFSSVNLGLTPIEFPASCR